MKDRLLNLVIIALLIVVILQMCNKRYPVPGTTVVNRDTTWIVKDSVIRSTPQLITHIKESDTTIIKEYYADENYEELLIQYNTLLEEFLARSVYSDSLKIDSVGYVHVKDSVTRNSIVGRSFHYNLNYPIIHDSITVYDPPARQLYIGVGTGSSSLPIMDQISLGLMYVDRKDRMFELTGTYDKYNQFGIQLATYWKIKL